MYPYFEIFGFSLPTYGPMALLGCLVCALYLYIANKRGWAGKLLGDDLLHIGLMAFVGVLVGAKLLYLVVSIPTVVANWDFFAAGPIMLIPALLGGMVFYGGFLGGVAAAYLYCRRYKVSFKTVVAIATPAIPLFHAFGRVGCFLSGCCWGIEVPWGIAYSHSIGGPNGVPLLPIQLIEAGFNLVLFVVLAGYSRRASQKWLVFPLYVLLYGAGRFALEFFRGDTVRGVLLFSTSQWIALALCLAVIAFFLFFRQKRNRQPGSASS